MRLTLAIAGRASAGIDACYASGFSPGWRIVVECTVEPSGWRRLARPPACGGAVLFVLTRRFFSSLLPEPGERQGRAGWARSVAPSPCSRGPEAQRPRAHPAALWSLVGRGGGRFGSGVQGTCCSDPPCVSDRGHLPGSARTRRPGGRDTKAPDARPRPPSRQSTKLSAIDRFPGSAVPFLYLPFVLKQGGRPWSPPGKVHPVCRTPSARVSPPVSRGATGSGMVLASSTDRVTTVVVASSCRRSRAGSDKEVTRS
jgi:hypothetical protein